MVLGLYLQDFWGLTKFDNGKNHFEFETSAPLEKSVFTNISKYKSINKGLSKAHKTATSSIQEYIHPNHGHQIMEMKMKLN